MKTVIAGALGECVHVAGVSKFLRLAEQAGWQTVFLGPAVSPQKMLDAARQAQAASNGSSILVGVSYRLTPETGERLLGQFAEEASELHESGVRFVFGGTPPVVGTIQMSLVPIRFELKAIHCPSGEKRGKASSAIWAVRR